MYMSKFIFELKKKLYMKEISDIVKQNMDNDETLYAKNF